MNKPYRWLVWKNLLSKLLWWNRGDVGLCNSQPCASCYCSCLLHHRLSFEESTSTSRVSQTHVQYARLLLLTWIFHVVFFMWILLEITIVCYYHENLCMVIIILSFCRWYLKKFEDYPKERKAVIPYLL